MEHTKTPWIIDADTIRGAEDGTICIGMIGNERNHLTFENWEANARRIVAAVNATANIKTEVLESIAHPGGHSLLDGASWKNEAMIHAKLNNQAWDKVEQLQSQNARLLDALKGVCQNMGWDDDGLDHIDYVRTARAAIAEAETSSAHPSQPAQVIANLTRKLGDAIKALRDIAETLMEITGGSGPVQGSVSDAREIAKEALKPYQPDSPDPTDLARDYNDALRDADQPTPYDP